MSTPFARSMRSLNANSTRLLLVRMFFSMTLFVAWSAWFFFAQITLLEISQTVLLTNGEAMTAQFSQRAQGRILTGQSAWLRLDGPLGQQIGNIPAIVTDVSNGSQPGGVQANLFLLLDQNSALWLEQGLRGKVQVEVEHISPAALVMRASGLFIDTPPLTTSPQGRE